MKKIKLADEEFKKGEITALDEMKKELEWLKEDTIALSNASKKFIKKLDSQSRKKMFVILYDLKQYP